MRSRVGLIAFAGVFGAAAVLLWNHTPLAEIARPERLAKWLDAFAASSWSPGVVVAAYVAGGFVMLPLTVLITATAMVYQPLLAIGLAFTGSMLSAASLYAVGAKFFSGSLRGVFGPQVERVNRSLARRGVIAIATVRMLPVAPFAVVNVAAGSVRVRFSDYLLGTALGLAPGIVALCVFANEVKSLWEDPTPRRVLTALAILLAWIAVSLGLQRWVSRRAQR